MPKRKSNWIKYNWLPKLNNKKISTRSYDKLATVRNMPIQKWQKNNNEELDNTRV